MLIQTDVNLLDKTESSDKNWNQSLNVHYYRVVKIMCGHHFGQPAFHYMWSPIIYFYKWKVIYVHSLQCVWNMNHLGLNLFTWWYCKDCPFFTVLCVSLWALPPLAPRWFILHIESYKSHNTYLINLEIFVFETEQNYLQNDTKLSAVGNKLLE